MKKRLKFNKRKDEEFGIHYGITNKRKEFLGFVYFYPKWEKWIFQPVGLNDDLIFTWDCLQEIIDYMKELKVDEKSI